MRYASVAMSSKQGTLICHSKDCKQSFKQTMEDLAHGIQSLYINTLTRTQHKPYTEID